MEFSTLKPNLLKNVLVRFLSFGVLVFAARFAFLIAIRGQSCVAGDDFCLFNVRHMSSVAVESEKIYIHYYSSVFQDLIAYGYLSPNSKSLCIETLTGEEVHALETIGVSDSTGISKKPSRWKQPFKANTFDFEFSSGLESSRFPVEFGSEVCRTLKPGGFLVVHMTAKDAYSFQSFLDLFDCLRLVRSRETDGPNPQTKIQEIVMKKERQKPSNKRSTVQELKREIIRNAEPLIELEPLRPWITMKRNIANIKYLTSMVDISFKRKYIYIDVGARSYESSIGNWFKKQYPKQNKIFEIYAIEADKAFHEEYKAKRSVNLLPYAAWIRNETLFFEINRDPKRKSKGRGMGRIHPVQSSAIYVEEGHKIQGFDLAEWLKSAVDERDFVVMKVDVEGAEFHLMGKMIETGAIDLVDEVFLECHYNRWQKCCPGERSPKYHYTYPQCLHLFTSLRARGVLVHQWL